MQLLDNNFTMLPALMNYSNAIFATLCIFPAYFIIKEIFGNTSVAFFSVLVLIFNPSFYQASIYGTPHLIAFFFLLTSVYFYLVWLGSNSSLKYPALILACMSLTATILFKSPLALAGGIYPALLYLRRVKDKEKILLSILFPVVSLILFFIIRKQLIVMHGSDTASISGISDWFNHYFGSISPGFIARQIKPPITGAGVITSLAGLAAFIYFIFKRRMDIILFVLSWSALTYFFWFFVYGNNARHFMIGVFPVIIMVILFFHEKAPKRISLLTVALILGNALTTSPSPTTHMPSGNLIKSSELFNDRIQTYHDKAKEIAGIDENKIAVMGFFHNPYVIYEILSTAPSYEAELLTSVKSSVIKIQTGNKEYIFCYINKIDPEAAIGRALELYDLDDYMFVSATFDLGWLNKRGIRSIDMELLPDHHQGSFKEILSFY